MLTAHPSDQLKATSHYFLAWGIVTLLLIGLAAYSGSQAVGLALSVLLAAGLVYIARSERGR